MASDESAQSPVLPPGEGVERVSPDQGAAGNMEPQGGARTHPDEPAPAHDDTAVAEEAQTVAAAPSSLKHVGAKSLGASGSLSTSFPGSLGKTRTWGTTAVSAMHAEEATRAAAFGRAIAILCVMALSVQPFVPPPPPAPWLKWVLIASLAALALVGVWVHVRSRNEARYTPRVFRVFAFSCVATSIVLEYHAGVFSPAPLAVTLGISFFGLGNDKSVAIGAPVAAIAANLVLALLITFHVIPDAGMFSVHDVPLHAQLVMVVLVPSALLVTLWQARLSRKATVEAIQRSKDAMRLMREREAQLQEAHQNLDRALQAGAGRLGRYSDSIAGRYRLGHVVGRGAMGEVYAAVHVDTSQPAAVKLLQSRVLENRGLVQRFLREGDIAKRLRVIHVVRVYEVGEAIDSAPYIAMELLQGHDLGWYLRQKHQLGLPKVTELVEHIAKGLHAAHDSGIVHRDLKPQNLFLAEREEGQKPVWKILDFGISKLSDSSGTLTQHAVVGTPGYMSPEQAQGVEADHRSDIFALGAVVYRALTGRPPFSGRDTPQILFDIVYRTPARPSEVFPSLPHDIDMVLAIAMAKHPEDRFASAMEFSAAFTLAGTGALDPATRGRAQALVARHPWGRALLESRKEKPPADGQHVAAEPESSSA